MNEDILKAIEQRLLKSKVGSQVFEPDYGYMRTVMEPMQPGLVQMIMRIIRDEINKSSGG
jgi:phage baseplate assembly protein W